MATTGLAQLLAQLDDAAVKPLQLGHAAGLIGSDAFFVDQKLIVAARHDFKVIIKGSDFLQLAVGLAVEHGLIQLARLAAGADEQSVAVLGDEGFRQSRIAVVVADIGIRDHFIQVFQPAALATRMLTW